MQKLTYTLSWEQNMGGGRGILMETKTECWQTARFIWIQCCKDQLPAVQRDAKVHVTDGTVTVKIDPTKPWPRQCFGGTVPVDLLNVPGAQRA